PTSISVSSLYASISVSLSPSLALCPVARRSTLYALLPLNSSPPLLAADGAEPYEHINVVLNADGSLTRLLKISTIPATNDVKIPDNQPILSKDVDLDPKLKSWLRIYLATEQTPGAKFPVVFYFHGGGWIDFSAAKIRIYLPDLILF
ncbi:hypothetical protein U1Q18_010827, partial [Sarracenia purpurea var. burkii]